ncbi:MULTISPECIES: hypothetical protein [Streptomyces]|uniref:Uncharacterized protein n=1 Tax=Streptomyces venezuelae (strain ATCC 10712 / CBS 650.69 / DSM 40230 / JCM 4526 / NBRC 13096 / PD 04745) TaxID=953739 RepID=F2RBY0_STRVP|nr:hypothetical protein [Streptomyces venezuelae]APE22630.1 hypothetical protein vnz_17500 [Streptomyces venezuelae]QES00009.1 hypothetical protein DEJ43_17720 [Streptomyces venezuelae ATCC 10712]CCA56841.1 hypothetical protein SVEN_3555 [Streptomyces venezuelae ATCC 10712]
MSDATPDWQRRLEACGLRVEGRDTSPDLPDVRRAHLAWAGYEVKPSATVSHARPDAAAELDRLWTSLAESAGLRTEEDEFCMLAPGPGGHGTGWIRVKDLIVTGLPSRLLSDAGLGEFMAVSVDGRVMCAVSDEEYDKWIVVHRFDEDADGA